MAELQHSSRVNAMKVSRSVLGFVAALALVALVVFAGVAIHELNYASDHPYAYGPAKVIAWAAGGGAVLAAALGLLVLSLLRSEDRSDARSSSGT